MNTRDVIARALTAAGYRILGPDELDPVTVERCAEVADKAANTYSNSRDMMVAIQEAACDVKAIEIASSIRSLSPTQPEAKGARDAS